MATTDARTDRSPSPLPPPPQSSTLGPRALALQNAFSAALTATLKKCSYDNFAACFPTPAQHAPHTMGLFHTTFTEKLDEVCRAQFGEIVEGRDVVAALNGLDRLVAEARLRKEAGGVDGGVPVPPHLLGPEQLLEGYLAGFVGEQREGLGKELGALQEENGVLAERLSGQNGEIEALIAGLEAVVEDLEAAAGMVQSGEVQGLGQDVKMMESELNG